MPFSTAMWCFHIQFQQGLQNIKFMWKQSFIWIHIFLEEDLKMQFIPNISDLASHWLWTHQVLFNLKVLPQQRKTSNGVGNLLLTPPASCPTYLLNFATKEPPCWTLIIFWSINLWFCTSLLQHCKNFSSVRNWRENLNMTLKSIILHSAFKVSFITST